MVNSGPNGEWFQTTPEFWERIKLPIIAWKIWISDGEFILSYDSSTCNWDDAPVYNLQVLMVYHPQGRRTIIKGRDEYRLPGEKKSKFGLMIDLDFFHKIQERAILDSWRP